MRTFYAFCINDFYFDMYNKHSYQLYKILEDIYYTKNYEIKQVKTKHKYRFLLLPLIETACVVTIFSDK